MGQSLATANQTPDTSQITGDIAVTTPTNTSYASSTASATLDGTSQSKTIRWSAFAAAIGNPSSIRIMFSYNENGSLVAGAASAFIIDYSLNNGSNWTNIFTHNNVTSSTSSSSSTSIPVGQDLTQVQVRVAFIAFAAPGGGLGIITTDISNVRIEYPDNTGASGGMM